ncbi:MAG UNVERIFIED_CONTAM: DUF2437 domain-containing protein [Planctomycetaceae bacterium]
MRLCKIRTNDGSLRVAALHSDTVQPLDLTQIDNCHSLMDILNSADPGGLARFLLRPDSAHFPLADVTLLAPVDRQEIWAAGVTYKRSQIAEWKNPNLQHRTTTKSTLLIDRSFLQGDASSDLRSRSATPCPQRQFLERSRA